MKRLVALACVALYVSSLWATVLSRMVVPGKRLKVSNIEYHLEPPLYDGF